MLITSFLIVELKLERMKINNQLAYSCISVIYMKPSLFLFSWLEFDLWIFLDHYFSSKTNNFTLHTKWTKIVWSTGVFLLNFQINSLIWKCIHNYHGDVINPKSNYLILTNAKYFISQNKTKQKKTKVSFLNGFCCTRVICLPIEI